MSACIAPVVQSGGITRKGEFSCWPDIAHLLGRFCVTVPNMHPSFAVWVKFVKQGTYFENCTPRWRIIVITCTT